MGDQVYAKLDVKDSEGNIVGFSFVEREKIPHLESLSMVPQGQEVSVSLEEDLNISSTDDDEEEDLHQSSCKVQQDPGSSVSSTASTSQDQESVEVEKEEEEKEDDYKKLVRLVKEYDKSRLARRLHDYSKFMKAFNAGWMRICKVDEEESIKVSYKSPDGKTFSTIALVSKYLQEKGSDLSKENFSFEKKFLGFERDHETISISESYHGQVSDRQSQEDPPEHCKFVWLRGGRLEGLQCLLCNRTFGGKYKQHNIMRHVQEIHQAPKHVCTKCGKSFTRKSNWKSHTENNKCKAKVQETKSKRSDSPNKKTKPPGTTVKEEPVSPGPASARVLIESPAVDDIRRIQVKLRSSRVMGEFLNNLLKTSGYDRSQVEWLCDGKVLTGDETAGFLHNKSVKYRIKN